MKSFQVCRASTIIKGNHWHLLKCTPRLITKQPLSCSLRTIGIVDWPH